MGLRHRSIRLRVGLLIAVPVLCLLALYGFVASITLGSAVTQQHARSLKDSLAVPVSSFQQQVAKERYLALLSLANPTNTQVASELGVQEGSTQHALTALTAALTAPDITSNAGAAERAAIKNLLSMASISNLSAIRGRVSDDAISMPAALAQYNSVINAGYRVIDEALSQQTNVAFVTAGLSVVNLDRAAAAAQAEWDLLSADLAQGRASTTDRIAIAQIANQRQSIISTTVPELSPALAAILTRYVPPATDSAMTGAETSVVNTVWRHGPPPAQLTAARTTFQAYQLDLGKALTAAGMQLQGQANSNADTVILELVLAAGLGLLGTIASIALSLVIGRGLVRQLRDLRESALTLAHERLPQVISKLRSGEPVEIADYAPGAVSSSNEIEQVQHAFAIVQQTAVQSAVDEARLRRGISDVFRNLAGRSQSLLHRQLTLLDGMERRATEPDELEDLFRIDHLTTRMRRHAEGLIILSGEAPARGWRQPVPLVDVLRAAVAEVEDYTRIRVLCRTSAAVAGHAVADVIHLIAELAENATVFSPPNTPVRIQGDVVGKGFAVEIEDRGLGISATRLEEINANLANPPQFDLSGSDRLGLFIAGQLAQRHDITITLRPSVYGGTTAIVLIPTTLVVEEDTFTPDPQLTAGRDDALAADALAGLHVAINQGAGPLPAGSGGSGHAPALEGGSQDGYGDRLGAHSNGSGSANGYSNGNGFANGHDTGAASAFGAVLSPDTDSGLSTNGFGNGHVAGAPGPASTADDARGAGDTSRYPSVPLRPGQDGYGADRENGAGLSGPYPPAASGYSSAAGTSAWPMPGETASRSGFPAGQAGDSGPRDPEQVVLSSSVTDEPQAARAEPLSEHGLPRRVRQASIAPQLRGTGPAPAGRPASQAGGHGFATFAERLPGSAASRGPLPAPAPEAPEPEAARNTMSALQRGWQLGRSEAEASEPGSSAFSAGSPASSWQSGPPGSPTAPEDPQADGTDQSGD